MPKYNRKLAALLEVANNLRLHKYKTRDLIRSETLGNGDY